LETAFCAPACPEPCEGEEELLLALTKHGATLALRGGDVKTAVLGVLRVSGRFWGSAAGACLSVEAEGVVINAPLHAAR
jgi:hypothetical protein